MTPEDATLVPEVQDWLGDVGWGSARRMALSGDASARRYERLRAGSGSAILMLAPSASEPMTRTFLDVTRWLRARGFSAPDILAADARRGLVLLEDLGDDLFLGLCTRSPALETPLYEAAIDLLALLHADPLDDTVWSPPPYDLEIILREARLALEWYLPHLPSADAVAEYEALVAQGVAALPPHTPAAVYRDYHAENLVWLPARAGHRRVGLLDYQDMLAGHPAYDVVSLLEDARRDVTPELRAAMTRRYLERTGLEPEGFRYAAHFLSAQRNLKILGIFARLARRDAKPRYLALLPRVWRYLMADLSHPDLSGLRAFVIASLPPPEAETLPRPGARVP